MENYQGNKTVNQRVASSSLAGGASLDKPAEMPAFSFSTKGFGSCNIISFIYDFPHKSRALNFSMTICSH